MLDILQNHNRIKEKMWDNIPISIYINKDIIDKDIDKLSKLLDKTTSSIKTNSIKTLINYLYYIKDSSVIESDNKSRLNLTWTYNVNTHVPFTEPISLIYNNIYKIDTTNYIETNDGSKIVEINIAQLANAIAFEYIYRDIDITDEEVEEKLKDCMLISYENIAKLEDLYTTKDILKLAAGLRIENSKYYIKLEKRVYDYFYTRKLDTDKYFDVINYSCKYAATCILQTYIENASKLKLHITPLLNEAEVISFIINTDNEENIKHNILTPISVQIFGRRFEVNPKMIIL